MRRTHAAVEHHRPAVSCPTADAGKFCCSRELPATVAAFTTGEVDLPWKEGVHKLEGRPTVTVSPATGDEATARMR